jgi:hypothetical protein
MTGLMYERHPTMCAGLWVGYRRHQIASEYQEIMADMTSARDY